LVIITLAGEHQARVGVEFAYRGPLTECRDCKLKGVCFNLAAGSRYRITSVRDVKHECRIHEDGVRVVEVDKVPISCAVPRKFALEGSTLTFEQPKCSSVGCPNWRSCHPVGVEKGMRMKVSQSEHDILCPDGLRMTQVSLE